MEKERARERQLATLKKGDRLPDREKFPPREVGKARDLATKQVGINGGLFRIPRAKAKDFCVLDPKTRKNREAKKGDFARIEQKRNLWASLPPEPPSQIHKSQGPFPTDRCQPIHLFTSYAHYASAPGLTCPPKALV